MDGGASFKDTGGAPWMPPWWLRANCVFLAEHPPPMYCVVRSYGVFLTVPCDVTGEGGVVMLRKGGTLSMVDSCIFLGAESSWDGTSSLAELLKLACVRCCTASRTSH